VPLQVPPGMYQGRISVAGGSGVVSKPHQSTCPNPTQPNHYPRKCSTTAQYPLSKHHHRISHITSTSAGYVGSNQITNVLFFHRAVQPPAAPPHHTLQTTRHNKSPARRSPSDDDPPTQTQTQPRKKKRNATRYPNDAMPHEKQPGQDERGVPAASRRVCEDEARRKKGVMDSFGVRVSARTEHWAGGVQSSTSA
jgi:hypothetical protein